MQQELHDVSVKCLFQLSASNFKSVTKFITLHIVQQQPLTEEDIATNLALLEHLNLNDKSLGVMIQMIGKALNGQKKSNIQVAMAKVVRSIIWSWIDNFPWQFISLCQSGQRLTGNPDAVFDLFEGWASNTAKKSSFWPVCTMLLILCPDIMLKVVSNDGSKTNGAKAKFLEGLRKGIKSSKLGDVAVRCYVDFCKAATFVAKSDISALRYIPPAVDVDLNERLFNQQNPFKRGDGTVDEPLMVECLKSFFYLSPRKIVNSLFTDCVASTSTPLFKRVFVDTLLQIANEQKTLEWNPTLSDVYSTHASNIRQMFDELLVSVRDYEGTKNATDKKGKLHFEKILGDIQIIIKLISLFKVDPALALYLKEDKHSEEVRRLLTGLSDCSIFYDIPELSNAATEALLVMHRPENIARWVNGGDDFWSTTSSVTLILASIVIERSDLNSKTVAQSLSLLENILTLRNQFINIHSDIAPTAASKHIRLFASTNLESAFLIHIGNSDTQIVSKCANVCRLLCAEVSTLRHVIDESDNSVVANYEAYAQLAESSLLSTGRQAQQKAIRTILKKVDRRTPGNFVAWDEVCFRWNIYTTVVKANEETAAKKDDVNAKKQKKAPIIEDGLHKILLTKTPADVLSEWTNYLGVLCSLNAVTINQGSGRAIGARATKVDSSAGPEEFLNGLMDLLVSEYVSIRETVKMMLGNAISPSVFTVLFKTLHIQAKQRIFASDQADFSPTSILFADQAISIVKLILETENDAESLSLLTGFEDLILLLIRFVRQLTINVNNLQIRHKLCGLLASMMAKSNLLNFRNAFEFRMQLVENIMEWTSEFSTKESNIPSDLPAAAVKQVTKLIKELDVQVMQAISSLLKGLPLQGKDDDTKASGFSKFFSFFTQLLTRCKKNPQTVLTPQLPEATIESLSFLVTANIEHGIEYFLSMGYYEDYESRSAFLRVLTNILKEGTDFDSGESVDKYYKLLELILDDDLEVALALGDVTPITEADKVAQLLVRVFEANDKALDLLKASIRAEVLKTEKENTLFRLNSMATKLLSAYCKVIGKDYLQVSVGPQIKQLIQNPRPCELDPSKIQEGENIEQNQKNILDISQNFLKDIRASIPHCPAPIREICKFLREVVTEKFPGAGDTVIAGFVFLRYLCPGIVAPDGHGIVDSPIQDRDIRRAFVLITKVLQNLANRVIFTKEVFMQPINGFIEANLQMMKDMFVEFAAVGDDDTSSPMDFTEEQKEEDLGRLHFYLSGSVDKLGKFWSAPEYKGTSPLDRVTTLLSQLGPPPELPKSSKSHGGAKTFSGKQGAKANALYEKFMQRMSNQDTSSIKSRGIFFPQGKTDKGVPVLYFIPRNWSADLEMDLFNYYLLSTIQPFFGKPFSVVVDLTFFSSENQIPISWCTSLYSVLPPGAGQHLDTVYILHPNQWFKKYAKRIGKLVSRITKRLVFCTSLAQLLKFIPEDSHGLPPDTTSIEKTIQSTFAKVMMTSKAGQYNKKEVKLVMSTDVLQIITAKQHPILNHNVTLVDLVPVSRITSISAKEKNDFTLSYNVAGPRTCSFSSSSADQIIQQLTALKDRQGLSKTYARAKTFQPSNVPGTLLNMALLNMTVKNYPLRVAAYNLLVTLCGNFAFNMDSRLLEAYDIAVPYNSEHFVVRVSEELAKSEPDMTLEFLQQAIEAISNGDKTSRFVVLDYIKPWLTNLEVIARPRAGDNETQTKILDILNLLVVLSIRETNDIGPAILGKVWAVLAQCPSIIDNVIQCLMVRTQSSSGISQLGEKSMDCAEDIIITLANENPSFIAGKLIHQFLELLEDNSRKLPRLESHGSWVKIEVLIRLLLTLSFENLISIDRYLPELFYIILVTFYSGDSLIRANVYALFMNIIHSMLCSSVVHPEKLQTLRFLFAEFQHLSHRIHFGVGGNKVNFSPYKARADRDNKLDTMPITAAEFISNSLFAVMNCCFPTASCVGSQLHSRWLSLTSKGAFKNNNCIQPRAISALGIICRDPTLVTDELIGNLLELLKRSLLDKDISDDYPISIINCLSHLFEYVSPSSKFYDMFFWICMSLCQLHNPKIFVPSVQLLHAVVQVLFRNDCFKGVGMSSYFLNSRKGKLEPMLNKIDEVSGLSFKQNFSFAVAGHLLKGLRTSATKAATTRLLTDLIDSHCEQNPSLILGYLAALMPLSSDDVSSNLRQIVIQSSGEAGSQSLFNSTLVPDKTIGALLFTFLATVLKSSEIGHEQLFVYRSFEEGVNFMPEIFPITFEVLTKKMEGVLNSAQNMDIMAAVLNIMDSIYQHKLDSTNAVPDATLKKYLTSVGFSGLAESDHFQPSQTAVVTPIVITVLETALLDP